MLTLFGKKVVGLINLPCIIVKGIKFWTVIRGSEHMTYYAARGRDDTTPVVHANMFLHLNISISIIDLPWIDILWSVKSDNFWLLDNDYSGENYLVVYYSISHENLY